MNKTYCVQIVSWKGWAQVLWQLDLHSNPSPGSITRTNCLLPLKMGCECLSYQVIVRCHIMMIIIVNIF